MATISATRIADTGTVQTLAAVAASDKFLNNGDTFYVVVNAGAGSDTVAIATPATVDGKTIGDGGAAVTNNSVPVIFGPFRPDLFNDSDGYVTVTHTQPTGVTGAAFKLR